MVTQSELSTLLIEHSGVQAYVLAVNCRYMILMSIFSVAAPKEGAEKSDVPAAKPKTLELSEAIATITSAAQVYSESKLPPALPTPYVRWSPKLSPPPPHDEHGYFPMSLYR